MNWLQEQIRNTPAPDVILHLGAGLCHELPVWQQSGASRIVLVEPNPELLLELRRRTERMEQVEIIDAAIAPEAGRGNLRLFNFPLLSSLREPTGLYHSLPGINEIGRATVDLLPLGQLLDQLDMHSEAENWLIIDTPGEEAAIVQVLIQGRHLHRFSRIFLTAGTEALYHNAEAADQIRKQLQAEDFRTVARPDHSDSDWPRYHLWLDQMVLECKRLQAEHKAELQATAKVLDSLKQVLAEKTKQAESLNAALESHKQKHTEEAHKLKMRLSQLEDENEGYQQRHKLLEEELIKAEAQIDLIKQMFLHGDDSLGFEKDGTK